MSTAGAPARERLGAPEKAAALGVLAFAMLIVSLEQYTPASLAALPGQQRAGRCAGSSAPRPPAGWPTSCIARRAWSPIICARWKRPVSSPAGRHVRAARTERGDELVALYEGD